MKCAFIKMSSCFGFCPLYFDHIFFSFIFLFPFLCYIFFCFVSQYLNGKVDFIKRFYDCIDIVDHGNDFKMFWMNNIFWRRENQRKLLLAWEMRIPFWYILTVGLKSENIRKKVVDGIDVRKKEKKFRIF